MEITRHLRLDRPAVDGRVAIHLRICWQSQKVRLSSGEKVLPRDWDEEAEQVKGRVKFATDINYRLDTYRTSLRKFFYKNENNGTVVTPDMVRAEVERIRVEELGQASSLPVAAEPVSLGIPTIQEFVPRYIIEKGADRSRSWRSSVDIVAKHLDAFRPGLNWPGLTISTLNLFKVYLQEEEELSDASLQTYVALLRGLLKYAGQSGMPILPDFAFLEVRRSGDPLQPELQHVEIDAVMNATLSRARLKENDGRVHYSIDDFEMTRWYFVIACHTGLRHSDLWMVQSPKITHIENIPCLQVRQKKTSDQVTIPLSEDVYHLIRNPPSVNAPVSRLEYNRMLKSIGEQSGLDRLVRVGTYYQGELQSELLKLYETMNSHIARRTFATLMTEGGMPTNTLQELMGHATIASTQKYSRVSNTTIVRQTLDAWQRSKPTQPNS